jgi:release factor glutamine methyltransferase
MRNKPNLLDAQINVSYCFTMNYEQITMNNANKNKPKQTRSEAEIPTGELLGILKPGTKQIKCTPSKLFLAFTFLCPSYNLAMQAWTIQKLLNWVTEYLTSKGIDSPRLSAELLLSDVLEMKRIELYTQFDKPVTKQQLDRLHNLVKRAGQHEPVCYLTGKTEFYCLELQVCPDCMIPRPETELLVERAIEFLRKRTGRQLVCDLCTGCGCIAIALARNYPEANIIATDISDAALAVAAKNIEKHQLKDRIKLLCGDLFDPLIPQMDVEKFDLIVCNPPYVSEPEFEKLDRNVKDYEPRVALFAGTDGLDVYRRIIEKADSFLKADAALMLEIGYAQGPAIKELLEQTGVFTDIKIEKDPHNNDRIVIAKR